MSNPPGQPLCPNCGSSRLTYKSVFRYYKCNECEKTFIVPIFNSTRGQENTRLYDLTNQLFDRPLSERKEEEKTSNVNVRRRSKPSNIGWLIFLIIMILLVIIGFVIWVFSDYLIELLNRLIEFVS